jgi:hypothetical protein
MTYDQTWRTVAVRQWEKFVQERFPKYWRSNFQALPCMYASLRATFMNGSLQLYISPASIDDLILLVRSSKVGCPPRLFRNRCPKIGRSWRLFEASQSVMCYTSLALATTVSYSPEATWQAGNRAVKLRGKWCVLKLEKLVSLNNCLLVR